MSDPIERDFAKYEQEQVESERDAERRDDIETKLNEGLVYNITNHLMCDQIEKIEHIAEKYNCDVMNSNTIMHMQSTQRDTEELLYEVIFRRNKSRELIEKYAKLLVDFFDISDHVNRIIKSEDDAELARKQLEAAGL